MRLRFKDRPWDLLLTVGSSLTIAAALLVLGVGNPLAALLLLFAPGYVLLALLFPKKTDLEWTERVALSFGISIAIVPLLGLALSFTPWGIRFAPFVGAVTAFTCLVGLAGFVRRLRLPVSERLALELEIRAPDWKQQNPTDLVLMIALVMSVVVASASLGFILLTPRSGIGFTEFYVLSPGGGVTDYPTCLNSSQSGGVLIRVVNHEDTLVNYTVRVDLVGVRFFYNTTAGVNETVEVNRSTLSFFNVTVGNGENSTEPYIFEINSAGVWKIQFLLFKEHDSSFPYRELHLFVRVPCL